MSNSFSVNVASLLRSTEQRRTEQRSHPLPNLAITPSSVVEDTDVVVKLLLEAAQEGILATGSVQATWHGDCRRCLRDVTGELRCQVRELFAKEGDPEQTYPIEHDHIDLEQLARDAILVELPLAPLCTPDCKGLCPTCGVNLNDEICDCDPPPSDSPWSALDVLRQN